MRADEPGRKQPVRRRHGHPAACQIKTRAQSDGGSSRSVFAAEELQNPVQPGGGGGLRVVATRSLVRDVALSPDGATLTSPAVRLSKQWTPAATRTHQISSL